MPKWARGKNTMDAPLLYRMGSAFENGFGNEGPLAIFLTRGCCLIFVLFPLIFVGAVVGVLFWSGIL
jgi:hypothetical protein